jgi:ketosteroid isomerase-like protein
MESERNFALMAETDGIAEAFYYYADDSAVIRRDSLYKGKEAIKAYYEKKITKGTKLAWTADFAEVARSCDLGYTYGRYFYSAIDPSGKPVQDTGIFHTVWKKQPDGKWKFVWD